MMAENYLQPEETALSSRYVAVGVPPTSRAGHGEYWAFAVRKRSLFLTWRCTSHQSGLNRLRLEVGGCPDFPGPHIKRASFHITEHEHA